MLFGFFAFFINIYPFEKASFEEVSRLLLLDGDEGSVACRIYGGSMSATIPRFSDNWTLESATRSLLRMNNLIAVRGPSGASMVGPADYLGNLEDPHLYLYTIQNEFPPIFYRTPLVELGEEKYLKELDPGVVTVVKAHWISGKFGEIQDKILEYGLVEKRFQDSLFPDPGLLEVDRDLIELEYFDPLGVDLSSFKARLVNNSDPFQITEKKLPSKDEYRLITYLYEPQYAEWQVENGSGLFLETHRFSQTISPIGTNCSGFVVLARISENHDELELAAVQIPPNHTLIIEEGCIHGDATLQGFFMMGMTSNHTTMQTADTVFLKAIETKKNVRMALIGGNPSNNYIPPKGAFPYVIYNSSTADERAVFRSLTQGKNFIFNPFSKEYWRWY